MSNPPKQPDLILGALPAAVINKAIGTELEDGVVVLTRAAQRHASNRHPADYAVIAPHLGSIVAHPLFVGDDFRNPGKFELIGRLPAGGAFVLVAVVMQKDEEGRYHVASFYQSPTGR